MILPLSFHILSVFSKLLYLPRTHSKGMESSSYFLKDFLCNFWHILHTFIECYPGNAHKSSVGLDLSLGSALNFRLRLKIARGWAKCPSNYAILNLVKYAKLSKGIRGPGPMGASPYLLLALQLPTLHSPGNIQLRTPHLQQLPAGVVTN